MRESFYGRGTGRTWHDLFVAAGLGLVGGLLGSYLMIFIGLTLSESGLIYLWPVAILLMLINMRFLCFSYAGGCWPWPACSLVFRYKGAPDPGPGGYPAPGGKFLIFSAVIWVQYQLILAARGRITGGFTLQKFWPIPLVVLAVIAGAQRCRRRHRDARLVAAAQAWVPGDPRPSPTSLCRWWQPWATAI